MKIRGRVFVMLASVGALAAAGVPAVVVAGHAQATPFDIHHLNKIQQRLISSELINAAAGPPAGAAASIGTDTGQGPDGAPEVVPTGFSEAGSTGRPANYFPSGAGGCSANIGSNVKGNQNRPDLHHSTLRARG